MRRQHLYRGSAGLALAVVALMPALVACDDSDSAPPRRGSTTVEVLENLTPVGSFDSQEEAAAKASDLASFEVQPIDDLPGRFTVEALDVNQAAGGNFTLGVITFIHGDPAGLLVTQSPGPSDSDPAWEELSGPGAGRYYRQDLADGGASYHRHTTDRTYSLVTHTDGGITDDEAIGILSAFLGNPRLLPRPSARNPALWYTRLTPQSCGETGS
jgi:hypothetical protein